MARLRNSAPGVHAASIVAKIRPARVSPTIARSSPSVTVLRPSRVATALACAKGPLTQRASSSSVLRNKPWAMSGLTSLLTYRRMPISNRSLALLKLRHLPSLARVDRFGWPWPLSCSNRSCCGVFARSSLRAPDPWARCGYPPRGSGTKPKLFAAGMSYESSCA